MPHIQPLANGVVLEDFQLGEVSKGGILIPQIAKASTPYRFAKVIAVGPGRRAVDGTLVPCTVQVGEIVAYAKNQGVEFPLDDEGGNEQVFRLINEQFILGIMRDLPEQSRLTGLDGRLLTMMPNSRAMSDGAVASLDNVARARRDGIIDTQGDTLDRLNDEDVH